MKDPRSAGRGYNDGPKRNGNLIKASRVTSQRMENDELGDRESILDGGKMGSKARRRD